ncbi:hypothetical protein OROGR_023627 [Orobanche gracilis]
MTVDRGSWRRRIRVADSFLGSNSVIESLRIGLSRGICAEPTSLLLKQSSPSMK